jgi:hypothetical protein
MWQQMKSKYTRIEVRQDVLEFISGMQRVESAKTIHPRNATRITVNPN